MRPALALAALSGCLLSWAAPATAASSDPLVIAGSFQQPDGSPAVGAQVFVSFVASPSHQVGAVPQVDLSPVATDSSGDFSVRAPLSDVPASMYDSAGEVSVQIYATWSSESFFYQLEADPPQNGSDWSWTPSDPAVAPEPRDPAPVPVTGLRFRFPGSAASTRRTAARSGHPSRLGASLDATSAEDPTGVDSVPVDVGDAGTVVADKGGPASRCLSTPLWWGDGNTKTRNIVVQRLSTQKYATMTYAWGTGHSSRLQVGYEGDYGEFAGGLTQGTQDTTDMGAAVTAGYNTNILVTAEWKYDEQQLMCATLKDPTDDTAKQPEYRYWPWKWDSGYNSVPTTAPTWTCDRSHDMATYGANGTAWIARTSVVRFQNHFAIGKLGLDSEQTDSKTARLTYKISPDHAANICGDDGTPDVADRVREVS